VSHHARFFSCGIGSATMSVSTLSSGWSRYRVWDQTERRAMCVADPMLVAVRLLKAMVPTATGKQGDPKS
jgi:hypothetical protein